MTDQSAEHRKRSRKTHKHLITVIPLLMVLVFFAYLWLVSGVLPFTDYYPGGHQLKSEGYVKRAGLGSYHRQGHWVFYHANGCKASEGFYENGKKIGPWSYWDEDGELVPADQAISKPIGIKTEPHSTASNTHFSPTDQSRAR